MKAIYISLAIILPALHGVCADSLASTSNRVVFREPFTLKLHVDKEHYYEQDFPKIPYVSKGDIYLFKDDSFGVDLQVTNGVIQGLSYQSDTNKAAVSFRFTQELKGDDEAMMLLVIENHTKNKLLIDALMTIPKEEKPQNTSILPIEPGLKNYESWPHPIVQLVLRKIRFAETNGPSRR